MIVAWISMPIRQRLAGSTLRGTANAARLAQRGTPATGSCAAFHAARSRLSRTGDTGEAGDAG
jgi:hypothetical protein